MTQLLQEIRHNRLLWLLVFVPAVFAGQALRHDAHTLLFVLSVLAIVPLMRSAAEQKAARLRTAAVSLVFGTAVVVCLAVVTYTFVR